MNKNLLVVCLYLVLAEGVACARFNGAVIGSLRHRGAKQHHENNKRVHFLWNKVTNIR